MPQRRVLFNVKNLDVFTPPPSPPPSTPVSVCVPLIFNYVAYFRAAFLFLPSCFGNNFTMRETVRPGKRRTGQTVQEMGKLYEIKIKENK